MTVSSIGNRFPGLVEPLSGLKQYIAHMARLRSPFYAYAAALAATVVAFLLVLFILLEFPNARSYALALPVAYCFIAGLGFAFCWPHGSWRWGLWVSSAFWLFFGFVFVSYLVGGRLEWTPAVSAILSAGVACIGAVGGHSLARFRNPSRTYE